MQRALIATGVLGTGTALTFAAAVLASSLVPSGSAVYRQAWDMPMPAQRGWIEPIAGPVIGKEAPFPGADGGWDDGGFAAPGGGVNGMEQDAPPAAEDAPND
jgi:hypothetical protein